MNCLLFFVLRVVCVRGDRSPSKEKRGFRAQKCGNKKHPTCSKKHRPAVMRPVHTGAKPRAQGQEKRSQEPGGTRTPKRGSQQPAQESEKAGEKEPDQARGQGGGATTWWLRTRRDLLRSDDMDAPVDYGCQSFRSWQSRNQTAARSTSPGCATAGVAHTKAGCHARPYVSHADPN